MTAPDLSIDFAFVDDERLRPLLEEYHRQALASFNHALFAATVVLCGGVLEGVVTWGIQRRMREKSDSSSSDVNGVATLRLEQLIDRAAKLELLGRSATQASWAVKDFRNYIHPYKALKGSSRPDAALAINALSAAAEIVRSLRGRIVRSAIGGDELVGSSAPPDEVRLMAQRSLNFCWLIDETVAGCRGPRSRADLESLRALGVRALVRLAATDEAAVLRTDVEAAGLRDRHEPVRDFSAPEPVQVQRALAFIEQQLVEHNAVAVSCGAGYGRTSTLLACFLVGRGRSADAALREIKEKCKRGPETAAQVELVRNHERNRGGSNDGAV